jgi:ubiquinone/menaquinone biosynthesis C-methylase UbiE
MSNPDPKAFYDTVMPDKMGADYEYARWHATPLKEAQYQMTRATISRFVLPCLRAGKRVLEVGPGAATWTKLLCADMPHADFTLLDISHEMLDRAHKALAQTPRISYVEADLEAFTTGDRFDAFFSSRALEYMPDKKAVVEKLGELLKEGARGAIITKMPKPFFDRLRGRGQRDFHSGMIAPRELTQLLHAANFKVEKIQITTATCPGVSWPALNSALYALLSWLPFPFLYAIFAESYCVLFRKV